MLIRKAILKKLFRHRYIGGRHSQVRSVMRGFFPQLLKEVKKEIKNLINQNFLLSKISTGEIHISLNPKMLSKIKKEISK